MISLKTALASATVLALTSAPALAQGWLGWLLGGGNTGGGSTRPTTPAAVPEIDGSTALLAVAAIVAVLAFSWERNRRRT